MMDRWLVSTPAGTYWMRVTRVRERVSPRDLETAAYVWFFAESDLESGVPQAVAAARALCTELSTVRGQRLRDGDTRRGTNELRRILEAEVRGGRLVCEPAPLPRVCLQRPDAAEIPTDAGGPVEELENDFIELLLVGEDGQPVGGHRYTVKLPNGEERDGTLNSQGFARIDGIPSGQCRVTFPELDAAAWQLAQS